MRVSESPKRKRLSASRLNRARGDRFEARISSSSGAIENGRSPGSGYNQNSKCLQEWTKMEYRFSWRALADSIPERRAPPIPVRLHRDVAVVLTPSIEVGRP
jgi:hypothetical protein